MDAPQKRQLLDAHSPRLFALTSFSLAEVLMVRLVRVSLASTVRAYP